MKTKITALLEEDLIKNVIKLTNGANTTESLTIALQDYVNRKMLKELSEKIRKKPLKFQDGFSAESIRNLNNNR